MIASMPAHDRSWRPPLVIQRSAVDCGLAAVEAALRGYGVTVPPLAEIAELAGTTGDGTSLFGLAAALTACGLRAQYVVDPLRCLAVEDLERGAIIADSRCLTWSQAACPWVDAPLGAETIPGHRRRVIDRSALPAAIAASSPDTPAGHAVLFWRVVRRPLGIDILCPSQGRRVVPISQAIGALHIADADDEIDHWAAGIQRTIAFLAAELGLLRPIVAPDAGPRTLAHAEACLEHVWAARATYRTPAAARRALDHLLALEPGTPPVEPPAWRLTRVLDGWIGSRAVRYVAIAGRA